MGWRRQALFAAGMVALGVGSARAGAWIPAQDQAIHTEVLGAREGRAFAESQFRYERPFGRRNALIAQPWAEADVQSGFTRGEVEAGLKRVLLRSGNTIVSAQASALWRGERFVTRCVGAGGEVRGLAGTAFGDGRGFLNIEAAGRLLEGGCRAQRFEVSAGWRAGPRWMGLAEGFVYDPRGSVDPSVKAQMSVVRMGAEGRGLQVGLRVNVDGGEAAPALVVGFWSAPRR